jgi:hypothetical protein
MGAGILPVTIIKGTIFFLLGKEKRCNNWSDFGGSSEINEPIFETAIREGYEELNGFIGSKNELNNLVKNNLISIYDTDRYTTHAFYVNSPYLLTLPYYFNNNCKYIDENVDYIKKDGIFEKSEIKLF